LEATKPSYTGRNLTCKFVIRKVQDHVAAKTRWYGTRELVMIKNKVPQLSEVGQGLWYSALKTIIRYVDDI